MLRRSIFILLTMFLLNIPPAFSQEKGYSYQKIVEKNLNEITKLTGTFDLYDKKADQVRNLRLIEISPTVEENETDIVVPVKFRDINSGDIVYSEVTITATESGSYESHWAIKKVEKIVHAVEKKEKYSDEEVRKVMLDYIAQQTKFTGSLMFFDENANVMRMLKLIDLAEDIRRFGILSIAEAKFQDIDTEDQLTIDIKVKNHEGVLEVDSLKIK